MSSSFVARTEYFQCDYDNDKNVADQKSGEILG